VAEVGSVEVLDFDGSCLVERDDELLARLRSVRRGPDGAFVLSHGGAESLWVHINGEAAFLCFFPDRDGGHPGFVPDGMWSGGQREVRFLLVRGDEASAIRVPWGRLVPVDVAYRAAVEFLHSPTLPASVRWFEL
jgi:Immunity protein Imm1